MLIEFKRWAIAPVVAAFVLVAGAFSNVQAAGPALEGVDSVKAVFDVRGPSPKAVDTLLKVAYSTMNAKGIDARSEKSDFAVVFIGPSVKSISTNRAGFAEEDNQYLDSIAQTIKSMHKDGVRLEICKVAADMFGVDVETVLPEIAVVANGWTSIIGYQTKGYALVPAY